MKYFMVFIIICLAQQMCKAQIDTNTTTGKNVLARIEQLQNKKIDTIVCYHVFCNGGMPRVVLPDSCIADNIVYLIWSENNKSFLQRFDECKSHNAGLINPHFIKLIRSNYVRIKKEKLKMPEYRIKVNGKFVTYSESVDHFCNTIFEIFTGKKILTKYLNHFDLDTKYDDDNKHHNINYVRNQKSLLNKLKKIIEYDVKSIKEN